jgi:parallel beta-helix repeat protein
MGNKGLAVLIVFEATVLGLVAMGVFGFLVNQYEQARLVIAERTAVAQATDVFTAMLTTPPPTNTAIPARTSTAMPTYTPSIERMPSLSPTPALSPTPTISPSLTVAPTPRPTRTPVPWRTLAHCDTIDGPGNYRLGVDLSANGDCIKVQTSYAVLDCAGHAIRGTNFGGYGIAIRKYGLLGAQIPAYIEIRNCRVSGFRDGIYVESGKRLVIRDNDSSRNYDDVNPVTRYGNFLEMTEGSGIRLNYTSDSQIFGNLTTHQAIGIDVRDSSNVVVRGNTSSDNSAWGINFLRTQNSEASNNTVTDNIRMCTWGAGVVGWGCDAGGIVLQDGSSNNLVANNSVSGRNGNGIFIKAHARPCGNNNSIVGNTITAVLYNSIELGFCAGNKINNNLLRDGLDGVWLGFAHDTEIRNNTIANMRNHGIISSNSHNNIVSGNQITNSNEGLYFFSEDYDRVFFSFLPSGDYRSHDNCLCGNKFQGNGVVAIRLKDSTSNQVTNNTFEGNGRTVIVQGNGNGNTIQENVGWWVPSLLDGSVAHRLVEFR